MRKNLIGLLALTCSNFAAADQTAYPTTLFEIAPQITYVHQSFPINSTPTDFWSGPNAGMTLRFTPIWRGKYPLLIHFGGQRLLEQNGSGITVIGEHMNEKYLWTFGMRMGFYPLETRRVLFTAGFEFNHDAFIRDLTGNQGHLNKVLFPTLALGTSFEWYRTESFSALLDLGFKADFSVPMDVYLVRNGIIVNARLGAKWRTEGLQFSASLLVEPHWMNTTLGDASRMLTAIEFGVGWGNGN